MALTRISPVLVQEGGSPRDGALGRGVGREPRSRNASKPTPVAARNIRRCRCHWQRPGRSGVVRLTHIAPVLVKEGGSPRDGSLGRGVGREPRSRNATGAEHAYRTVGTAIATVSGAAAIGSGVLCGAADRSASLPTPHEDAPSIEAHGGSAYPRASWNMRKKQSARARGLWRDSNCRYGRIRTWSKHRSGRTAPRRTSLSKAPWRSRGAAGRPESSTAPTHRPPSGSSSRPAGREPRS